MLRGILDPNKFRRRILRVSSYIPRGNQATPLFYFLSTVPRRILLLLRVSFILKNVETYTSLESLGTFIGSM